MTILSASSVLMLVHCVVKYCRPPGLKASSNASLPFARITEPATDPSFNIFLIILNLLKILGLKSLANTYFLVTRTILYLGKSEQFFKLMTDYRKYGSLRIIKDYISLYLYFLHH